MSDFSHHPATSPSSHPSWCSPLRCVAVDSEVHHASAPEMLTTGDAVYETVLIDIDQHGAPAGPPSLMVDITSLTLTSDLRVYLTMEETGRLIQRLTDEYYRMRLLSTPEVRPAVTP